MELEDSSSSVVPIRFGGPAPPRPYFPHTPMLCVVGQQEPRPRRTGSGARQGGEKVTVKEPGGGHCVPSRLDWASHCAAFFL